MPYVYQNITQTLFKFWTSGWQGWKTQLLSIDFVYYSQEKERVNVHYLVHPASHGPERYC